MADHLNEKRSRTIQADCLCRGRNSRCVMCDGVGTVTKLACLRCGGTGKDGSKCPDCRGHGWRDLDNMNLIP